MKPCTLLLGVAAGLASAGALHFPQHHVHAHVRREPQPQYASTTSTTVWTVVTVTASPGDGTGYKPPVQDPPVQNPPVQAAEVKDTDRTIPSGDVNAIQLAKNQKQVEANNAHQSSMIELQKSYQTPGPGPQQGNPPASNPPPQQPSSTTTSTNTDSTGTGTTNPGGSPPGGNPPAGGGSGKTAITYYDPQGAPGACQNPVTYIAQTAHVVALSQNIMNKPGNMNLFCNKKITVQYNGQSHDAIVADTCLACSYTGSKKIDFPRGYLESFAPDVEGPGHAVADSWSFDDASLQSQWEEWAAKDVTEGTPTPPLTPDVA